ncbi:putative T7SS-secreted protein [Streptomyces sp. G-G2]|uniref:putative T7SS-secreted protein n=1 Tax=Streptomyces sp. G-G2 TaxID=3046201 RepID=UPI0024BA26E4|nr:RHS repeat-associated core domain-containing protein [Streptomyces sp. G-G2]MDJ0380732.1 RHS repeat-associated core domain-containing protein [Streptomyces sp. G-G2]
MGLGDFIPDSVEDWVEDRTEDVGDAIEWTGDKVAGLADKVGLEDAGDWIRDKSRSAANQLGADVAEMELGQTEDPTKLVYGSVSKIRAQAAHLHDFKAAFDKVGGGLKGMDSDGLKGKTVDAFRESVAKEPPRWFKAAESFGKAAVAMGGFAETVEWAQGRAKEALADYNAAKKASTDARAAYNKQVDTYNDAVDAKKGTLPPKPGAFTDPGTALAKAAQDKLDDARRQRNEVAETARIAVGAARDAAPPKPSYGEQFGDGMQYVDIAKTHLTGGVIKGTAGLVNFVRSVNPTDPYNLTHPAEYATSLNSTAAGLVTMVNDPMGAGKQMLDQFMKDPSEGVGKLLPELIGTKGLGLAKKAGTAAKLAEDIPTGPGRKALTGEGPDLHKTPDGERTTGGTDPVDLATGRMYLPQTDVVLPGALPLVFNRRAESGYTAGRWFGPSWSSTADQHLEIDAEGVVLVAEDGLLIGYPHPAPGVPVLPVTGPLRPLERTPDGDYTLTDPVSGQVRRFVQPLDGGGDGLAPIVELADRNGNFITFEYDAQGAPLGMAHSGGYHLAFETAGGRITALHLTGGPRILGYGYTSGHLTEVTNSCGLPLRFSYDERGRITSWTDTNDSRYDYAYDDRDRCVAEGGSEGHLVLTLDYDGLDPATGHRVTSVTTAAGATRRYLIDDRRRVVAEIDPLGAVTRYTYDRHGRPASRTDALGATSAQEYDASGRIVRSVRPDGRAAGTEYDALGLPTRVANADGTVVRQTYDERGNRTSLITSTGAVTSFAYDERGHLTAVTNPLGAVTRSTCDAAGLPLTVTDPLGAVTRFERDAFGRPVRVTDPLGGVTVMEWTTEGRPARRVDPDGSERTWQYDGEGNCTVFTDPSGGVTRFEYTHFDLLAARTGPDGVRHTYAYDAGLRLTGVRNPQGLSWEYTYDAAGRLVSEADFDGRTLSYAYDPTGRLSSRVNALGEEIGYERDVLGRIVRKTSPDGTATFEYDVFDLPAAATSADGTTLVRIRDRHGRLAEEHVDGRVVRYAYDELSRPVARTTPAGAETRWTYDAAGHCTGLTASGRTLAFERDAAGRELTRRIGENTVLHHTFDPAGRLTTRHITGSDQRTLQRRGYTYRADGNLLGIDDEATGPRSFTLDAAARVTGVDAASWSERYAYDEAGNQTSADWPQDHPGADAAGEREYTGTRITRAGRVRYEHDAQGRVVLRQRTRLSRKPDTWRYVWDADDRLAEVTTPDGTRWCYRYDALGRRTAKQRLAGADVSRETAVSRETHPVVLEETRFTWDGTTLVEQTTHVRDSPHEVTLSWTHAGLHPLTQVESIRPAAGTGEPQAWEEVPQAEIDSRFFAIVTDLVGTPTEMIDEEGALAWRTRSTVWGATSWNRDASAYTPLRFPGQYYDPETGLHHNYFRTYDPETARYLTSDPLGLTPSPNPMAYVSNPLVWADPLGLSGCKAAPKEQLALPKAEREPPNMYGTPITSRLAQPGEEFNMVLSKGQPGTSPGGFGTFEDVPNQQFVRDQLAIRTDWKDDVSMLQRYRFPDSGDPIRIQESIIGPQTDPSLGHLPGGVSQLEILNYEDRARLIPVGPPVEIPK